jgi:hypothetical protein
MPTDQSGGRQAPFTSTDVEVTARPSPHTSRARHTREIGQSLAEFAVVLPILVLVLGAIVQFGMIFWAQNTLTQIARDTGRWAATHQECTPDDADVIATANDIAAVSALFGYDASNPWGSGEVTVTHSGSPCPPTSNLEEAWVTVSIKHSIPLFFPWIPGVTGDLSTSTQFRMEPTP